MHIFFSKTQYFFPENNCNICHTFHKIKTTVQMSTDFVGKCDIIGSEDMFYPNDLSICSNIIHFDYWQGHMIVLKGHPKDNLG